MIDVLQEGNIKTVVEKHVSVENVHSSGRWSSYITSMNKPVSTNRWTNWSYSRDTCQKIFYKIMILLCFWKWLLYNGEKTTEFRYE